MNIVITGASSGIGLALAKLYASPNTTLGLIARNSDKLARIESICRQQGATVICAKLDVTDTEELKNWLLDFDRQFPINLLIANAGVTSIMPKNGEMESWESICQVLNTNIHGVFNTIYPIIEPMRRRHQGQIAIISSLAAFRGLPITPTYCASKAAVKSYGEALQGCLKSDGVNVSVICPGFVTTDLSEQFPEPKIFIMSADKAARIIQRGLKNNKPQIDFPSYLAWSMKLLALLPSTLANWILTAFGYGIARDDLSS